MYLTTTRRRSCRTLSRLRSEEEGGFLFLQNPLSRARFLRQKSKREQNLHSLVSFQTTLRTQSVAVEPPGALPARFLPELLVLILALLRLLLLG